MSEEIHEHDEKCLSCGEPSVVMALCTECYTRINRNLDKAMEVLNEQED